MQSQIKKIKSTKIQKFHIFLLREQIAWGWEVIESCEGCYSGSFLLINDGRSFWRFLEHSLVFLSPKLKKCEIWDIRTFDFFNWERRCDLTDVSAHIYDRQTTPRRFDPIPVILLSLSLAQAPLKDRNAPFLCSGNRGVKSIGWLADGSLLGKQSYC